MIKCYEVNQLAGAESSNIYVPDSIHLRIYVPLSVFMSGNKSEGCLLLLV